MFENRFSVISYAYKNGLNELLANLRILCYGLENLKWDKDRQIQVLPSEFSSNLENTLTSIFRTNLVETCLKKQIPVLSYDRQIICFTDNSSTNARNLGTFSNTPSHFFRLRNIFVVDAVSKVNE